MTTVDEFVADADGNQFPIARVEVDLGAFAGFRDFDRQRLNLNWTTGVVRAAIRQE